MNMGTRRLVPFSFMEYLTEQQRIALKVEEIIEKSKEIREKLDPKVLRASDSALEFMNQVRRKGSMHNRKKTVEMREAFEQNYKKLHP